MIYLYQKSICPYPYIFLAVQTRVRPLNRWHCHSVSQSLSQSEFWQFWQLLTTFKKYDILWQFWQFFFLQFWHFCDNFDIFWQILTISAILTLFRQFWHFLTNFDYFGNFDNFLFDVFDVLYNFDNFFKKLKIFANLRQIQFWQFSTILIT